MRKTHMNIISRFMKEERFKNHEGCLMFQVPETSNQYLFQITWRFIGDDYISTPLVRNAY